MAPPVGYYSVQDDDFCGFVIEIVYTAGGNPAKNTTFFFVLLIYVRGGEDSSTTSSILGLVLVVYSTRVVLYY
jgi:hypothetical protein